MLSALLSFWLARTLLAPIKRVARATHRLAAGHYDTRVTTGRADEIDQLGRDFNHLADTLERNEQMRRTMMADISHELRTPLSVLRGELEALEHGVRPLTHDSLHSLAGEVALLSQLVEDLYDLSLSDVGALTYRKVEVDLVDVLSDVLGVFEARLSAAGIALEAALPAAPDAYFRAISFSTISTPIIESSPIERSTAT
ncbi:MAG: HAMP domain-containing protein [Salinisphaera sp.]|nr:HAMP domain-containing protein [Salinisphaera sp.]